ncbi:MAG: hypothetical protein ACXW0J_03900 [Nitrososphaeraceae archaeon]
MIIPMDYTYDHLLRPRLKSLNEKDSIMIYREMKKIIDHIQCDEKDIEMNKVIKIQDRNAQNIFSAKKN